MAVSTLGLAWLDGLAGMALCLFGLGLGWNFSYVAATTELVSLTAPSERGRLVGFSDLLSSATGASLVLIGGAAYSGLGVSSLAIGGALLALTPALWMLLPSLAGGRPSASSA
jgi:hypothetical protein